MRGKILKGISGFYYVYAENKILYECKAKGIFRLQNKKPLVGDDVELEVTHEGDSEGNITKILDRSSELIRPAVANIDQALVIFAITHPDPNLNLLDRFLIMMEQQGLPCVICFNKSDISSEDERALLQATYEHAGYRVVFFSALQKQGLDEIREILKDKTTTVAGPSGVGKSSLINALCPDANMEVGEISKKIKRGKNTTRHTEIFAVESGGFIMDTPGFSSLNLFSLEKEDVKAYYSEFRPYDGKCLFASCVHVSEPDCAVKAAVKAGEISKIRYDNYRQFYEELKETNRRK